MLDPTVLSDRAVGIVIFIFGIGLCFVGVGVPILYPNRRWVGWLFVVAGSVLLVGPAIWLAYLTWPWFSFAMPRVAVPSVSPNGWLALASVAVSVLSLYLVGSKRFAQAVTNRLSPSVLLTYESPKLHGFSSEEIPAVPLGVHNEGGKSALKVSFSPVAFDADFRMEIDEIGMIGPYANAHARIRLIERDEHGGIVVEDPEHLGWAVFRADMRERLRGNKQNLSWPLVIKYIDSDKRPYEREYAIDFDTVSRRVNVRFMR